LTKKYCLPSHKILTGAKHGAHSIPRKFIVECFAWQRVSECLYTMDSV